MRQQNHLKYGPASSAGLESGIFQPGTTIPDLMRNGSDGDAEQGLKFGTQALSRATIPIRQANRSQTSLQGEASGSSPNADAQESQTEEYPWGPSHPCFPHPNSHVPLSSPLYKSTRVIRIKRDWMIAGDVAPAFSNLYPEILDPSLPEDQFRQIIEKLNSELFDIFSPWRWRNWLDIILGALTFWIWDDLGLTDVKRRLTALEGWLEQWNREVGGKEGVTVMPLRRTAYMTLDIVIPDPHIDMDAPEHSRPDTHAQSQPQRFETESPLALPIMGNDTR
ncbi:MAG: hypothetical protein M1816_004921 [Peltula sp. TS41687]|nr:MAG: hypothetical protein M1816_004921 [Peltula sp. TS41687]